MSSPEPSTEQLAAATAQVWLKPRKAGPFVGRHPWVLDTAVARVEGEPADGDVVDLIADRGDWLARGLYNSSSKIRVRLYTWRADEALDDAFWRRQLEAAVALRHRLGLDDPSGAARLVFSEADGLSGLVVDRYGEWLSVQINSLGLERRSESLVAVLDELLRPRGIVLRSEKGVARREGLSLRDGLLRGALPDGPIFISENGLRFGVDLVTGHKTGFYLDQRDNRRAVAALARDARVLDLFCYSGGFGLTAAALGGAREVLGIDTSDKAIALARANAELNGLNQVRFEQSDVFAAIDQLAAAGEKFDLVVLDPPKFAQGRESLDDALRAYHRLNRRALDLVPPGGILVTCSCSGHVSRDDFLILLAGVAQKSGREIQVLESRGAAPDHPTSVTCLQTQYLKCLICRVV
ncbi:MAG: class I SAM-dependent rRNA methyltransferase [Pirellulales bacterium]|nr:class I SAM-dependent rRNA methyltransferase [Pirellulales bacterium]